MTHADDARREAEQRYPRAVVGFQVEPFIAGAEWQASQPVTVTTEQVQAHRPIKGGSSASITPGHYSGDWVICSCAPGVGSWHEGAPRIPIADYPAHLLAAVGVEVSDR